METFSERLRRETKIEREFVTLVAIFVAALGFFTWSFIGCQDPEAQEPDPMTEPPEGSLRIPPDDGGGG